MILTIRRLIHENTVIFANASSLVMTTGLNSALGFVYWWFAAQAFTPASVGFASSLISAITLLGTTATLGFGMLLISELPKEESNAGDLFLTSLVVGSIFGFILGLGFVAITPLLSIELAPLLENPLYVILFALGAGLTTASIVFDQAMIGLLRGGVQLRRNILFSMTKFALLIICTRFIHDARGFTIFITWIVSILFSISIALLFEHQTFAKLLNNARVVVAVLRTLRNTTLFHYMLDLTLSIPSRAMPIIVTSILSASLGASYYIAWMIASLVYAVTDALTLVLFASGNKQPELLLQRLRMTIVSSFLFIAAANVGVYFASPVILKLFGDTYALEADWALRILCFGGFALIIKMHFVALRRVFNRTLWTSISLFIFAIVEIGAAVFGAKLGQLTGLTIGWVVVLYIEAGIILIIYFNDDRYLISKETGY